MITEFSKAGTAVSLAPDATLFQKLRMLLGHYDLRVYITDSAYLDVGRGSFDAVKYVDYGVPRTRSPP